ncbi:MULTISPECIES: response regulator [Phyllobacterium]|nr:MULTISPECIES: response regulator [Phyllobacterium]MBZ9600371.1 response regulator [Phyllobacterium sp. KW56]
MTTKHSLQDVLIVEDQHLMRLALVHELQAAIPACVVHAAATIATALELIEANQFALILIDPGLPGYDPRSEMDRLKTISTVVERTPAAIHIVITGAESAQEWEEVRTIGVAGYIAKNSLKPGTMTAILQSIADHGCCVGLMHETSMSPEVYHAVLSPREQELVQWMMQRPANISRKAIYDQLGEHLNIDAASAERYYKRARAKLLKFGQLPESL